MSSRRHPPPPPSPSNRSSILTHDERRNARMGEAARSGRRSVSPTERLKPCGVFVVAQKIRSAKSNLSNLTSLMQEVSSVLDHADIMIACISSDQLFAKARSYCFSAREALISETVIKENILKNRTETATLDEMMRKNAASQSGSSNYSNMTNACSPPVLRPSQDGYFESNIIAYQQLSHNNVCSNHVKYQESMLQSGSGRTTSNTQSFVDCGYTSTTTNYSTVQGYDALWDESQPYL